MNAHILCIPNEEFFFLCVCVCVRACVFVCMCACMCVTKSKIRKAENQTDGQTSTNKQTTVCFYQPRSTYRPVIVEMTQFVSEPLHVVRLECRCVMDDIEMSWGDSTLADTLTHQKEVIPTR